MSYSRDGAFDQPSYTGSSHIYDRTGVKTASLRMASPRIGATWADEDYASRRTYSPPSYLRGGSGLDRSFRISDSSPSERRRLVAELRSEVRKASTRGSSPLKTAIPSYHNGGDYGVPKRSLDASYEERRGTGHYDFDEANGGGRKRTTEEEAERELAELERSTENLRRLGSDMLSSTSAYIGQARTQPGFAQRVTQLPRPVSDASNGAYPASPQVPAGFSSHGPSPIPAPMYASYMPPPYVASGQAQGQPQYVYPGPAPGQAAAMYPPPAGYPAYYMLPPMAGYPPMMYPMAPPPGYQPVTPQQPQPIPQTEPVVQDSAKGSQQSTPGRPVETAPSSEGPKLVATTTKEVEANVSPTEVTLPPIASTNGADKSISVPTISPAIYEPSGLAPSAEPVVPAHVNLNDIEDERQRRKREFLAKRQKDSAGKQGADLANAAADAVSAKTSGEDAPPMRQVIFAPAESEADLLQSSSVMSLGSDNEEERSLPRSKTEPAIAAQEGPSIDEESERAIRLNRQADEASRLKPVDNSMALVTFGSFLKHVGGGSYDDADLAAASIGKVRPPPLFGKGSSDEMVTGRRRAQSFDSVETNKGTAAPPSLITKPTERQPIMMQGYLMKTSGPKRPTQARGTWQKRFFILSGRLLLYTAAQGSTQVKRMIDLNRIDVVTDNLPELDGAPTGHCIGLLEKGEPRMLTICAQSHEEILAWYKAIVTNCALLCEKKLPQKSLPPPNRTKTDARTQWRKDMEARHASQLPPPPPPEPGWFYPEWVKPKSYYDMLGVPPDATGGMIKKSYYKIAKDSHPDRSTRSFKGIQEEKPVVNPEEFAGIALAYETLIDPEKRSAYDLAEKVKEELRRGIECLRLVCLWDDDDLQVEPRLRTVRKVVRQYVTLFCDGEIRCLYWQPSEAPDPNGVVPLKPLRPSAKRSIEMRFVQQVLYFRDGPIDFGKNGGPAYEGETRFVVMGDRLHTGPLLFQMDSPQACNELVHGLRVARCEKSMLFQQKLDALKKQGIQ